MGMGELIIVTMLAGGMFELVRHNGGIDYIIAKITRHIHGKRGAEGIIASLVAIIDVCTATAIVASIVVIIAPFIPSQDLFWAFFSLNLVMFLLSYVPMFPGFLKLRKNDPDSERPFKVPGGNVMLKVMAYVPMVLIIVSIIFTL